MLTRNFKDKQTIQRYIVKWSVLITIVSIIPYAVVNIVENELIVVYIASIYLALFISNSLLYFKSKNFKLWSSVTLFLFMSLLWFTVYEGGIHGSGLLGPFLFPSAAFFIKGHKKGAYFSALFFAGLLVLYLLCSAGLINLNYSTSPEMVFAYFAVLLVIASVLYLGSRQKHHYGSSVVSAKEKFETLYNNIPLGVILLSPDMKLLEANQTMKNWFPEDKHFEDGCCYEIITNAERTFCPACPTRLTFVDGHAHTLEQEKTTVHGVRLFKIVSNPIFDRSHKVTAVINTLEDITESKRASEAIRASEERFRVLIQTTSAGVYIVHGIRFIEVNAAVTVICGYSRQEFLDMAQLEIIHPDDRQTVIARAEARTRGEAVEKRYETRILTKAGETRWVDLSVDTATINGMFVSIGTVYDITARKLAEDAVRESEQKFRFVAENATDVIWILNPILQKFKYVSPSVHELLQYTPEEVIAYSLTDIFTLTSAEILMKIIPEYIEEFTQGIKRTYFNELEQLRKDGSVVWTETTSCYAHDQNTGEIIVFGTTRNISERKEHEARQRQYTEELERINEELAMTKDLIENILFETNQLNVLLNTTKEELEKLNAEKDKFFAIIAHDLRSPFNGFIGLTELMVEDINEISKEELLVYITELNKKAKSLFSLLKNLLEWARMQRGQTEFEPVLLDFARLAEHILNSVVQNAKAKNITLDSDITEGTTVFADANMLNSIVLNLVTNAVKFTPQNGTVQISAKVIDEKQVQVSVQDSGIGMSAELLQKLFRIDQKVSRKGTLGEDSTGLGLLLCKEFVEKNGGTIWAESTEGKGSTFFFTLPRHSEQLAVSTAETQNFASHDEQ